MDNVKYVMNKVKEVVNKIKEVVNYSKKIVDKIKKGVNKVKGRIACRIFAHLNSYQKHNLFRKTFRPWIEKCL